MSHNDLQEEKFNYAQNDKDIYAFVEKGTCSCQCYSRRLFDLGDLGYNAF